MPWNRRYIARKPAKGSGLVHHSDRGVQYLSIKYSGRLAEAGIDPSVGSVGDSYDNALAETINGLYKARRSTGAARGDRSRPSNTTLEWVDNNQRLLGPNGNIPPAEAEANHYLLIHDTPPVGMYVLNMFRMRGSRLWGSRLHRACVV